MKFGHEETECYTKDNVLERGRKELAQRQRVAETAHSGEGQHDYQPTSANPVNHETWYPESNSVN